MGAFGGGSSLGGLRTDGLDEEARLQDLGIRILPPYPGDSLVPLATVPSPRLLTVDMTDVERVRWCATVYRSVVANRFYKPSHFMMQGDITAHRNYGTVLRAAGIMSVAGIPPMAWVLWMADWWKSERRTPEVMPAHIAMCAATLEKNVRWFNDVREAYMGGQRRFGHRHLILATDWGEMWTMLLRERPTTRDAYAEVVARVFPGDSYERRLREAVAEAQYTQAQLAYAEQLGEVLW